MMQTWSDEAQILECVAQSNLLAHISTIDMKDPKNCRPQEGHYGAFMEAFSKGRTKTPLTEKDLIRWHKWILQEQSASDQKAPSYHVQESTLRRFIQALNSRLGTSKSIDDEVQIVNLIAETLLDYFSEPLFVRGNGRIARLIANYLFAWCMHPLVVFREEERQEIKATENDANMLRLYLAKKLRESVYSRSGQVLNFIRGNRMNGIYATETGSEEIIQWTDLAEAEKSWSQTIRGQKAL